jgi:hypothetical protein
MEQQMRISVQVVFRTPGPISQGTGAVFWLNGSYFSSTLAGASAYQFECTMNSESVVRALDDVTALIESIIADEYPNGSIAIIQFVGTTQSASTKEA